MKTLIPFLFGLITLASSCASRYNPVHPELLQYRGGVTVDSVDFKYRYDVMSENENKKYAKKELRKGYRLLAIEVTNNSSKPVTMKQDYELYHDNYLTPALPLTVAKKKLRQNAELMLLYSPVVLFTTKTEVRQVGNNLVFVQKRTNYPIGAAIGLGNFLVALNANSKFKKELRHNDLWMQTIQPHQKRQGFLFIKVNYDHDLTLKKKDRKSY